MMKSLKQAEKIMSMSLTGEGEPSWAGSMHEYLWGTGNSGGVGDVAIDALQNAMQASQIDALAPLLTQVAELYATIEALQAAQPNAGEATHRPSGWHSPKTPYAGVYTGVFKGVYDEGGTVPGPRGSHHLIVAQAGEVVIPADEAEQGAGDQYHLHIYTSAPYEPIVADFYALRALKGALP
jgi:hypothetical protein